MMLSTGVRKLALVAHVSTSVGWLGSAAAYLALVVHALTSGDPVTIRATYLVLEPIAWYGILPLAVGALLTGIVSSLGTHWGLFRHYWILLKFLLSILGTAVLLGNMSTLDTLSRLGATATSVDSGGLHGQILHSGGGLAVLLIVTVLAVVKPKGMTRYGWRRTAGQR